MTGYHTEQKKILLQFLRDHHDRAFTVEQTVAELQASCGNTAPGKSTVYRLMQRLVVDGEVKRFVAGNSRRFVYQLMGHASCHSHLHLKCRACGRLFHLDEQLSHDLSSRLAAANGFSLSESDTVLFGDCADCRHAGGSKA